MTTRVKICGITNEEDAFHAARAGADLLGFIFAESPRRIDPQRAREIVEKVRAEGFAHIIPVGVFVNEPVGEIVSTCVQAEMAAAQMHGDERPDQVLAVTRFGITAIKSFRIRDQETIDAMSEYYAADFFLCDTYDEKLAGGTGRPFNHALVEGLSKSYQLILAGGLKPENVAEAIRNVEPWAVDVSSGVEASPGKKDPAAVEAFIRNAKSALA
jgi:phosphoribosylanthranilate isomerase